MRNDCFNKVLVVGIIVLFLGVSFTPVVSAFNLNYSDGEFRETDDTMVCQNEGKPDLKIVGVEWQRRENGFPYFFVSIKNCGQADATWNGATRLFVIGAKNNKNYGTFTGFWGGQKKHAAGTIKTTMFSFGGTEFWFSFHESFCRLYFEVDFYKVVDEENEENNGVWAYSYIICIMVAPGWLGNIILGRLRPWNPNDGIVNRVNYLGWILGGQNYE